MMKHGLVLMSKKEQRVESKEEECISRLVNRKEKSKVYSAEDGSYRVQERIKWDARQDFSTGPS